LFILRGGSWHGITILCESSRDEHPGKKQERPAKLRPPISTTNGGATAQRHGYDSTAL